METSIISSSVPLSVPLSVPSAIIVIGIILIGRSLLKRLRLSAMIAAMIASVGGVLSARTSVADGSPGGVCYAFDRPDTPFANESGEAPTEVWCYRRVTRPEPGTMIFSIDGKGRATPELTFLVADAGSITHASRTADQVTVHRIQTKYNPLPVPTVPPPTAKRLPGPMSAFSIASADDVLGFLSTRPVNVADIRIRSEGMQKARVPEEAMPWRGYWFPQSSGRLHHGSESPLAKFDRFVELRTGIRPQAQAWEKRRHRYTGVKWSGHCNGWAAASILRKEPTTPWIDPFTGVTFSVLDQKGILIERDYCPRYAFFGRRTYSAPSSAAPGALPGVEISEPPPPGHDPAEAVSPTALRGDLTGEMFHNTLAYFIGQLGKPVLMDYSSGVPVENRVLSEYEMNIKSLGTNVYRVDAKLTIHEYDKEPSDQVGVAPVIHRTYSYKLWTDDNGEIERSAWLNRPPDFLWLPLAPGECKDGNPALTESWIEVMGKPLAFPEW